MHKIEIFIPLYYNDNTPIEIEKIEKTRLELLKKFGALTGMPSNSDTALDGWWTHQGKIYRDKISTFRVDCNDFNQRFWTKYKSLLKKRFRQEEIYITRSEINTI